MRRFLNECYAATMVTLLLAAVVCGLYPLSVWAVGQALFPHQANGSLIGRSGRMEGSYLIGQAFRGPDYFHSRPSAAGPGYDASASSGSNLGPTSKALLDTIAERVRLYRASNGLGPFVPVPVDAVTASASGLDPHISPENARLQARRVAQHRRMSVAEVEALVRAHTEGRTLLIFGEPRVNVVRLNLALNERRSRHGQ